MRPASIASRMLLTALIVAPLGLGGCTLIRKKNSGVDGAQRLAQQAPPVRMESLGGLHMLVMQAPNPGWTYQIDRDDIDREGWVIWVTIRKPDPAFMYPQRVVDKRLLTQIEAAKNLHVMARVLEHNEKGSDDQYARLRLGGADAP